MGEHYIAYATPSKRPIAVGIKKNGSTNYFRGLTISVDDLLALESLRARCAELEESEAKAYAKLAANNSE